MLWPDDTRRGEDGALRLGGVSVVDLAEEFGTPLYIYDEATLRGQARRFVDAFAAAWPDSRVVYAGKALMSLAIVDLLHQEGVGLDVVSGGELFAGLRAGIPAGEMTFHGNNKSVRELQEAVAAGVGLIAIDNLPEIALLSQVADGAGRTVDCLLRINPGIDTHTHDKIRTGHLDSKFGLPVETGDAARAVAAVVADGGLRLRGYHVHVGSQLFDSVAWALAVERMLTFAAAVRDEHGVVPEVICPGGGFGIAYADGQDEAPIERWAMEAAAALREGCARFGLPEPTLVVEPGRSIVGRAGVALYRVGSIKHIPGVRTFVTVDGGMTDNIRPTLYDAVYHAELASRAADGPTGVVTVAGKYCESGDILIERAELPEVAAGDLLALPAAGAYCLAMASNYNMATRPAVMLVRDGQSRLIRRRERYEDLLVTEVFDVAAS